MERDRERALYGLNLRWKRWLIVILVTRHQVSKWSECSCQGPVTTEEMIAHQEETS